MYIGCMSARAGYIDTFTFASQFRGDVVSIPSHLYFGSLGSDYKQYCDILHPAHLIHIM
jgi:hypothetical protein